MNSSIGPIALLRDEGEALWFLGILATIKADGEATGGRLALIEHLAPKGAGSPLHMHRREDEWFYILEGELKFWVGGQTIDAPAGAFIYGPRNIPHTFLVTSDESRFLLGAEPAGFENFIRALAEPARATWHPPVGENARTEPQCAPLRKNVDASRPAAAAMSTAASP